MAHFMEAYLYNALVMSVITACFLLLLKGLLKRYSTTWLYGLSLFIAALWIFPRPQFEVAAGSGLPETAPALWLSMLEEAAAVSSARPGLAAHTGDSVSLLAVLVAVWVAGMAAITLYYVMSHRRFMQYVHRWSVPITDRSMLQIFDAVKEEAGIRKELGFRACKGIATPMLIGLRNPTVLLPDQPYTERELSYIVKHECLHYRRKDLYAKLLIHIATILHWFNPLVWLLNKSMALQCELACDEQVLKGLDAGKRKDYGRTILNAIGKQMKGPSILSTHFLGGRREMVTRISSMMDNKAKKPGLSILAALLLGIAIAACSYASEPETLAGYMVVENNTLYLDEVEVVTTEDEARMAELGLHEGDLPNGYYIHHLGLDRRAFALTEDTVYTFTDFHLLFVEDADGNRLYTTTRKEEFIQHLSTSYSDTPPAQTVPFFIEIKNGKVISLTEKLIFTQ